MAKTLKSPEVNERIRYLREEILKEKQGVYAADLGITQGAYSEVENMRSNPSARLIRDICLRDNVNKEWLLEVKSLSSCPFPAHKKSRVYGGSDQCGECWKLQAAADPRFSCS